MSDVVSDGIGKYTNHVIGELYKGLLMKYGGE